MKKIKTSRFLYIMSALLILGFAIRLGADYIKYNPLTTSAPFYVNIIIRAAELLLPALTVFIAGRVFAKKEKN